MKTRLADIAELQFGLYSQPQENGNTAYLLGRYYNDAGRLANPIDSYIDLEGADQAHLLTEGDLLLAGKGVRNFAAVYYSSIGPAVASSMFFVIRPEKSKVLPEYLSLYLNASHTQSYFQTLGAGSNIQSIRKSEIEALEVPLPPIHIQRKIVDLKQLYEYDMELSSRIIQEKRRLFQTITQNLINNYHE